MNQNVNAADQALKWVDKVLDGLVLRPKMWAIGLEALESQVILACGFRLCMTHPDLAAAEPGIAHRIWRKLLTQEIGFSPNPPCFHEGMTEERLVELLKKLVREVRLQ